MLGPLCPVTDSELCDLTRCRANKKWHGSLRERAAAAISQTFYDFRHAAGLVDAAIAGYVFNWSLSNQSLFCFGSVED
jgi:hypothetical protein